MGLQWCPRDPLVKIGDQTLQIAARIPVQYQNRFDSMRFRIYVPKNVETEILYVEDQATVEFVEDNKRRKAGDMLISVECGVSGIPDDTPAQMLLFAAWSDSSLVFVQGEAGSLSAEISI